MLVPALEGCSVDLIMFFEVATRLAPRVGTVRHLCAHLDVMPSTLVSRFFRAGVPSPRCFLAWIRLLHGAHYFETPGFSVADVAYRLDFSSPQSFGRHLKLMLGLTPTEFRRQYPFDRALTRFVARMVEPHRERLRRLHPLKHGGADLGQRCAKRRPLPVPRHEALDD